MRERENKQRRPFTSRGLCLPMKAEVVEALRDHCADKEEGLHRWAVGALIREAARERFEEADDATKT